MLLSPNMQDNLMLSTANLVFLLFGIFEILRFILSLARQAVLVLETIFEKIKHFYHSQKCFEDHIYTRIKKEEC